MKLVFLSLFLFSNFLLAEAVWTHKPITLPDATADMYYSYDLNSVIRNDSGDPFTVGSFYAPHWMHISLGGFLSGTPSKKDIGQPLFTLRLTDYDGEIDDVEVFITVK
jgi:hypothetical protein